MHVQNSNKNIRWLYWISSHIKKKNIIAIINNFEHIHQMKLLFLVYCCQCLFFQNWTNLAYKSIGSPIICKLRNYPSFVRKLSFSWTVSLSTFVKQHKLNMPGKDETNLNKKRFAA